MEFSNLNGINSAFLGEARSVLSAQVQDREATKTANFVDGECFLLELNKEAITFIEKHGENYKDSDKTIRVLNVTSLNGEENASCMCAIVNNAARINSDINGNKALHFKLLMANEFTKYIKNEISKVAVGIENAENLLTRKREHDIEVCSVLSWSLQQARDIYYFLANDSLFKAYDNAGGAFPKGAKNNIGANHIDSTINTSREYLKGESQKTLIKVEELMKKVLFSKNYFYSADEKNVVPYSVHNTPNTKLDDKTFYNRIEALITLRGVTNQSYDEMFTEEQKNIAKKKALEKISSVSRFLPAKVVKTSTNKKVRYKYIDEDASYIIYILDESKPLPEYIRIPISKTTNNSGYESINFNKFREKILVNQDITFDKAKLDYYSTSSNYALISVNSKDIKTAKPNFIEFLVGDVNIVSFSKKKGTAAVMPKKGDENFDQFQKAYDKELKPDQLNEIKDLVDKAIKSLESAALASNIDTADQRDILFNSTIDKIDVFRDKPITSLDEINCDYLTLRNLINTNCEGDPRKEHLYHYLDECTSTRIAILNSAASKVEEEGKETKESGEYIGDSDEFVMGVVTILPLGKVVSIDLSNQNVRNKKSWFKKLFDAQYELMGYHLPASAQAVSDAYKKTRNLEATLIKKAGELIDIPFRIVDPNFNLGHNLSQAVSNELQRSASDINPKLINLEEDLRNPAKWARSHDPLKKHINREDLRNTYRYKITDKTYTDDEKQEAKEEKENRKVSKYLHNVDEENNSKNESMNYTWLNLNPINEDFAAAGAFACTPGGYEQCGEIITPNTDFNYPGVVSGMGDSHAPTPDQTPFNGNEKTSVKDSGSGDFGSYRRYKENKKKHKSKLLK